MKLQVLLPVLLIGFSWVWGPHLFANTGTVRGIVKDKFIAVDAGTNKGFEQRVRVCIFDMGARVACGLVVQARADRSFVRVRPENLKKVRKGMEVRLFDSSTRQSTAQTTDQTSQANGASNLKMAYILTPMAPATYHAVSYATPTDAENPPVSTLWDRDRDVITSVLGFGAELGLGIGSSKMTVGGRMRIYKGTTIKSFYNEDRDPNGVFAETRMAGSAFGAWADFYYLSMNFGTLSIDIGNGLDLDFSEVTMTMTQKEGRDVSIAEEMYNYKSNLMVASLRTNLVFNLFFDPLGIQFGTFLTVPLTSSLSTSVTVDDPQSIDGLDQASSPEDDLIDAINHRASGFGVELFFSAYYAF